MTTPSPERRDGYGLKPRSISEAAAMGIRTIVACDNGTNAVPALRLAESLGVKVLVVDHHPPGPDAVAWWTPERSVLLWNPMAGGPAADAMDAAGQGREACAAMLVDLVAAELLARCGCGDGHRHGAELAGIASVTDVMPARGANRAATRRALDAMASGDCLPGLARLTAEHLIRSKVIEDPSFRGPGMSGAIGTEFVGFDLGPRLNACGRTGDASLGVGMLLATAEEAPRLSGMVESANEERRRSQRRAWESVRDLVRALPREPGILAAMARDAGRAKALATASVRVMRAPGGNAVAAWVPGVVAIACSTEGDGGVAGLVASSMAGVLGCPSLYCGMSAAPDDHAPCVLVGSGRVPEGCGLLAVSTGAVASAVFAGCGGEAGGHSAAFGARIAVPPGKERFVAGIAGLTVRMAVGLAAAVAALGEEGMSAVTGEGATEAEGADMTCDLTVTLSSLTAGLAAAVGAMGPYGPGFQSPRLLVDMPPTGIRPMGSGGTFTLEAGQGRNGPRVVGFAGSFDGGAPTLSANGSAERMAREGCVVAGSLKPSYYGMERAGSSWRGPAVELMARAIAARPPREASP